MRRPIENNASPGQAVYELITLLSDTAYHSFIGEVKASNITKIRRLPRHAVTNFWP